MRHRRPATLLVLLSNELRRAAAKSWSLCDSCSWMGDCRCFPDCFTAEECVARGAEGLSASYPNCSVEESYATHYKGIKTKWRQFHMDPPPPELSRLMDQAATTEVKGSRGKVDCTMTTQPHPECFTRMIHQSWKTADVPAYMREWSHSWRRRNRHFEYRLWTDDENRAFLQQHYAWFVPFYDAYGPVDRGIKRADAVRIFYMWHFGGVYADLDSVCLRPFESLFEKFGSRADVLVGRLKGVEKNLSRSYSHPQAVPNAIMVSKPRARFWLYAMRELVRRLNCWTPMYETGPQMLTDVVREHADHTNALVLDPTYFYPVSWNRIGFVPHVDRQNASKFNEATVLRRPGGNLSYAATFWTHTWDSQKAAG